MPTAGEGSAEECGCNADDVGQQIGMCCLPGTTRRPSAPMTRPMRIALMMSVMVIVPPNGM
jgi:hypothetical protein